MATRIDSKIEQDLATFNKFVGGPFRQMQEQIKACIDVLDHVLPKDDPHPTPAMKIIHDVAEYNRNEGARSAELKKARDTIRALQKSNPELFDEL